MSKNWYQQSINALQLNGKGERTQKAYTRALRQMVDFCGKPPAKISEAELEAYFLHRRNVDGWSPNTMRISYCGIRFFFVNVLKRDWHLFQILRAKSESRLPAVRTFGCLSPSFGMSLDELKARVEMAHGFAVQQAAAAAIASPPARCCRYCGGPLRYRRTILPLRGQQSTAEPALTTTIPAPGWLQAAATRCSTHIAWASPQASRWHLASATRTPIVAR